MAHIGLLHEYPLLSEHRRAESDMEKKCAHSNVPVTGITIRTGINVSILTAVFAVHRRLIVFVTAETRELRICRIVRMTLTACCPLA
jgi:hypothetical protein